MQEIIRSEKPLKPSVLGLVCPPLPPQQKISWNDVAIIVEVKDRLPELVQQFSTYAGSYLAVDRRRFFFIAIAFNHKKLQMHFLVFHRSGLSSSHGLSLHSEPGFNGIVGHMVGILSIADEKAFGIDSTRFVHRIYERKCVRGRATVVYNMRVCTPDARDTTIIRPQFRCPTLVDGVAEFLEKMVCKMSYQTEGHCYRSPASASRTKV